MEQDTIYKDLLDNISDGVYFVDVNRKITYWNKGAERLTGYKAYELLGSSCADNILVHVDQAGTNLCKEGCPLLNTINDGSEQCTMVFMHHKEGHRLPVQVSASPIYSPEGSIIGAIEIFRDNSSSVKDKETIESLKKAVLIDPLTEIGNRRYIEMQLESSFEQYTRHDIPFGVLMIDIDNFKIVNDTYGHDIGDTVLKMVANTLAANVRSSDLIGRFGGEEFTGILQHVDESTFPPLAEKLRMLVEKSFIECDGQTLQVTITLGAAFVKPGDSPEAIIKRADNFLYKGKSEGKNRVIFE